MRWSSAISSAAIAAVLTAATLEIDKHGWDAGLGWVTNAFNAFQLPALFAGAALSGNVHHPNTLVTALVLFVMFWIAVAGIWWLVKRLKSSNAT